jgi:C2 domain
MTAPAATGAPTATTTAAAATTPCSSSSNSNNRTMSRWGRLKPSSSTDDVYHNPRNNNPLSDDDGENRERLGGVNSDDNADRTQRSNTTRRRFRRRPSFQGDTKTGTIAAGIAPSSNSNTRTSRREAALSSSPQQLQHTALNGGGGAAVMKKGFFGRSRRRSVETTVPASSPAKREGGTASGFRRNNRNNNKKSQSQEEMEEEVVEEVKKHQQEIDNYFAENSSDDAGLSSDDQLNTSEDGAYHSKLGGGGGFAGSARPHKTTATATGNLRQRQFPLLRKNVSFDGYGDAASAGAAVKEGCDGDQARPRLRVSASSDEAIDYYNKHNNNNISSTNAGRMQQPGSEEFSEVRSQYSAEAASSAAMPPGRAAALSSTATPYGASPRHNNNSNHGPRPGRERARYSVYHGSSGIKKKFRVRPYHCYPDQNVTMTEEEIYADSLLPSKEFVLLKSYLAPTSKSTQLKSVPENIRQLWGSPSEDGRIGSIRVEVLGCVSLSRTKPDVSVYLVCGDAAFCTDVLNGYRSPMWPCVSRRACVFPVHHAFAKLYVGIFDARIRKNKENDVFCGRVVVDLASLRPDTEYDTTMPLRASAFVYDKRKRGVIRLRLSLHWFSERAAVMSYFKSVRSIVDSSPLVEGQPAIPCADPKTFRNVAVTVYGQDLPGKYSRTAFRATMREFNLYQQNIHVLAKLLVLDAMLYEKPWMSLYLFCAAMYSVMQNSVRTIPALFVGYILILYLENYRHYVESKDSHLGYKPVTIQEVLKALVLNQDVLNKQSDPIFAPIAVEKRAKRRRGAASQRLRRMGSKEEENTGTHPEDDDEDGSIAPLDHREFPFSDRDAYPKRCVEESLAPGSGKGTFPPFKTVLSLL